MSSEDQLPTCPECHTPIQPTWDWCHACGFDPEGLKPADWQPSGTAVAPPGRNAPAMFTPPRVAPSPGPGSAPFASAPPSMAGTPMRAGGGSALRWVVVAVAAIVMVGVAVVIVAKSSDTATAPTTTSSTSPSTTRPPTPFTSSDGSFSIQFPYPHQGEVLEPSSGDPKFYSVDAGDELTEHFVIWSDPDPTFSPTASELDRVLISVTDAGVDALHGTVLDRTFETFRGQRALNFAIKNKAGTAFGRGLSFFSRNRLFVIVALAEPKGQYDFTQFTTSFQEGP